MWQGIRNQNPEVQVPRVSSPFRNRAEAGDLLAARLSGLADRADVIVLALPRGGVPVGYEVANSLGVALMCSWCANSVFRGMRSWRWAPSPAAVCGW